MVIAFWASRAAVAACLQRVRAAVRAWGGGGELGDNVSGELGDNVGGDLRVLLGVFDDVEYGKCVCEIGVCNEDTHFVYH